MPWQRQVADVAGELDPETGRLAYREVVVTVMRQQGKTTLQLPIMVDRCLSWGSPQHVTYAAQNGVAARQKFMDEHVPMLLASPLAAGMRVRRTSGHEALLWQNGSRHTLTAAKETSGHGMILDGAVVDEAFAYQDPRLEQAFIPAMQTRPDPQLVIMSTAGYEPMSSPYLWGKVERGRARAAAGETSLVAYFEWSFADDDDPFDPATWRARMPALGHTVTEAAVGAAAASMEEREFIRAFGNRWQADGLLAVIDAATWARLADLDATFTDAPKALAIDVTPDRSFASIGAAGMGAGGVPVLDLVDHRPGTEWVVDRLLYLRERHKPCAIAIDPRSPAGSLLPDLEVAGIEVLPLTTQDAAAACGGFYDACVDADLRHLAQPDLNAALAGARKREMSEGAWLWDRKKSAVISPLVAVTNARWAWTVKGQVPPRQFWGAYA